MSEQEVYIDRYYGCMVQIEKLDEVFNKEQYWACRVICEGSEFSLGFLGEIIIRSGVDLMEVHLGEYT